MPPTLKLIVVGDSSVGKTSLLIRFETGKFPEHFPLSAYALLEEKRMPRAGVNIMAYAHLVFTTTYSVTHIVDGEPYIVQLWDTPGDAEYDRLRPLAYPQTDVFIMCFSVVDPDSYEDVRTKWSQETAYHNPSSPVLLVGTKTDLRKDSELRDRLREMNASPIQFPQGLAMRKDIGAAAYIECSALTGYGVQSVFEKAMLLAARPPPTMRMIHQSRKSCVIV
ncbi:Ras-related C3 botulinum toxin substrate 1 [Psilocybe cubensis]|uniref:Ras-related C3 botulinum toxin substrate 1 n=2 Tax=Psilocybe cubensis TaxID=181762 RepID=A0ACB8H2Q2_PSICU|nr:Ras-related C3 botulinum toxin substrate 1 [Psilocybe cubensis]KAH9482116.1 Ras-related C3 botulinum toxin substrate 1 [Psilocybe cubensis]